MQLLMKTALVDAIKEKNLRVALDVFKDEPEGKTGEVNSSLLLKSKCLYYSSYWCFDNTGAKRRCRRNNKYN